MIKCTVLRLMLEGGLLAPAIVASQALAKTQIRQGPLNKGQTMTPEKLFKAKTQTLKNGLRIIVVEDHDVPRVSVGMLFNVGSADDPESLFGISHMAEHMYFKGTQRYPKPDVTISYLGGSTNAYTSRDCTMFITDCPSGSLPVVLDLEADRLAHAPKINMEEFPKERDAVWEERLMRVDNDPLGEADEFISAALNPLHPYGKEIIGTSRNIRAYTAKDVSQHYETWYVPGNATLIVVGDVEAEKVFRQAETLFGKIPTHTVPSRENRGRYSLRWNLRQEITYTTDKVATTKISLLYNAPHHRAVTGAESIDGPRIMAALQIGLQALFGGVVYEFERYFVNKKQLVLGLSAHASHGLDPEPLEISATLRPGVSVERFRKIFDERLARVLSRGLSKEDFKRSKQAFLHEFRYEIPDSHSSIRNFWAYLAKGFTFEEIEAAITFCQDVTLEQANAALRLVFGQKPCSVVVYLPKDEAKAPDEGMHGPVSRGAFPLRYIDSEAAQAFGLTLPQQKADQ